MSPRNRLIAFIAGSVLIAGGAGFLIYYQKEEIKKNQVESARLEGEIAKSRALIKKTPELIKEVIIQRETDGVIKEILSDQTDVNNLVRTLYAFAEAAGVQITSLKEQRQSRAAGKKDDFDKVAYTMSFEATGFEVLDYLDRVESHTRFMSVTALKLTAARRSQYSDTEEPRHRVQLDLETYVYEPNAGDKEVKIDGYEQKRDLLISEITKRSADLRIPVYDYNGARGRRDPWVDPRVPVSGPVGPSLPIPDQIAMVEELVSQALAAEQFKEEVIAAASIIEEMKALAKLDDSIATIGEQVRRIDAEGTLTYIAAERRFQQEVAQRLANLVEWRTSMTVGSGPSISELEDAIDVMQRHINRQEYELALDVFESIEPRLRAIPPYEEERMVYARSLAQASETVRSILEFEEIALDIGGVAIYEGKRPVALINGQPISEGELVTDDLVVRNISQDQIEFAYRGLVLARPIESR